ncbi:MAG: sulfatase [Balneolales bacterium]
MNKLNITYVLGCLLLTFLILSEESFAQDKSPNFIFILTDDHGWSHTSIGVDSNNFDSKSDFFETPNIDRLIKGGMSFTNAYAPASICSPTRRSIQYGMTPARLGDEEFENNFDPNEIEGIISIPWLLKSANRNYQAAHYGKWDLRADIFPEDLGYDESDGNTGNRDGNLFTNSADKWDKVFITNNPKRSVSLAERSVNFMERQVKKGNPFYLQISHYAPHIDIQSRQETYDKYLRKQRGVKHYNAGWAAMLEDMDMSIGIILDKVESLGISDNTYIIFMSDNGAVEALPQVRPAIKKLQHPDLFNIPMRNHPLRGGKWTLYEGGIRVPYIVQGPGVKSGSVSHEAVVGWDILPTISELANYNEQLPDNLDGGSFAEIIKTGGKGKIHRANDYLIFHRFHSSYGHSAIIQGNYKLIIFWKSNRMELYNLENDLGEVTNLAKTNPEKVDEIYERLTNYIREVNPNLLEELLSYKTDLGE